MRVFLEKYLTNRVLSITSLLILFLPFLKIIESETVADFVVGDFAYDTEHRILSGFGIVLYSFQNAGEGFSVLRVLFLAIFCVSFLQIAFVFLKRNKLIPFLSIFLILALVAFYVLLLLDDSNPDLLFGYYIFGLFQLLLYYRS